MNGTLRPSRLSWTHPDILAATVPAPLDAGPWLATGPAGLLARTALRIEQSIWASSEAFYTVVTDEAAADSISCVATAVSAVSAHLRANGLVSPGKGAIRDYADAPGRTAAELAEVLRKVAAELDHNPTDVNWSPR